MEYGGGETEGAGVGAAASGRKGTVCQSVLPSSPLPAPYPVLASVCRSAGLKVTGARLEKRAPRKNRQERSRSGKGWAVTWDGVRGRTLKGTESAAQPARPAPATAGEACGKACWENGGLSERRGEGGWGLGRLRAGWDAAGSPGPESPSTSVGWGNLGLDSGKGRYENPGLGF